MIYFFVGLLLVSLAHLNVANYNNISDLAMEQLIRRQQASAEPPILPTHFVQSCDEASTSGVYELRLSTKSVPFTAFCDVESLYGKWLVIQQRVDGSVDFNRSWAQYRDGFGVVGESTEFWLGLEKIYQITSSGGFELAIELKNETGGYGFARFEEFAIGAEHDQYQISRLGSYSGTIGDGLRYLNGHVFVTVGSFCESASCITGWWRQSNGISSLNEKYGPYSNSSPESGIFWTGWTNAATYSRMMIRRK